MKIDMHFHFTGNGKDIDNIEDDVYFNPDDNNLFFTRVLYNLVEEDLIRMEADLDRDGQISTKEYLELCYRILAASEEIEGVVLLGLDAVYNPKSGELDEKRTDLWVSNKFLSKKTKELNNRLDKESGRQNTAFWRHLSPLSFNEDSCHSGDTRYIAVPMACSRL